MPKDTKVYRCVKKVKAKGGKVNPYAVCQASTKQSYATGKPLDEGLIKSYKKRQLLKKLNRLKGAVTIGAEDKELRALKMDHLKSTKPDTTGPNAGYGFHNDALNRAIKRVKGLKEEELDEKNTLSQLKHAVTSHQYEAGATRKRAKEFRRGPLSKAVNAALGRSKMNVSGEKYYDKLNHKANRHNQAAKVADELRNRIEYPNSKKTKWSKLKEDLLDEKIQRLGRLS